MTYVDQGSASLGRRPGQLPTVYPLPKVPSVPGTKPPVLPGPSGFYPGSGWEAALAAGKHPVPGTLPAPKPTINPYTSYLTDPEYVNALATGKAEVKTQYGNSLASIKDALLGFGSQQIAREVLGGLQGQYQDKLGVPLDFSSLYGTISDNPDTSTSTLAQLQRAYRQAQTDANTSLNSDNLFYSGARAKTLRDLEYAHESDVGGATANLRAAIAQALGGNTTLENQVTADTGTAESHALDRAINAAIAAGWTGGDTKPPVDVPPGTPPTFKQISAAYTPKLPAGFQPTVTLAQALQALGKKPRSVPAGGYHGQVVG